MSRDYLLLITGSRTVSQEMLTFAVAAVKRAHELGWHIVVGDAEGIDYQVMVACEQFQVPYTCYGITPKPRNGNPSSYIQIYGRYPDRDRHMAEICDRCLAIWNGFSKGTILTYSLTKGLEKPADLKKFKVER